MTRASRLLRLLSRPKNNHKNKKTGKKSTLWSAIADSTCMTQSASWRGILMTSRQVDANALLFAVVRAHVHGLQGAETAVDVASRADGLGLASTRFLPFSTRHAWWSRCTTRSEQIHNTVRANTQHAAEQIHRTFKANTQHVQSKYTACCRANTQHVQRKCTACSEQIHNTFRENTQHVKSKYATRSEKIHNTLQSKYTACCTANTQYAAEQMHNTFRSNTQHPVEQIHSTFSYVFFSWYMECKWPDTQHIQFFSSSVHGTRHRPNKYT